MDGLIPWEELEERIRPFYPNAGRGRRPYELSAMLGILYIKRHFGYAKVRYRGLSKNTQRLMTLLGFANLMRAEQYLEVRTKTPLARSD